MKSAKDSPELISSLASTLELTVEQTERAIANHDEDVEAVHAGSDVCVLCLAREVFTRA